MSTLIRSEARTDLISPERARSQIARWIHFLRQPIDGASLAVFRACFGAVMLLEVCRYFVLGWVHQHYIAPEFHFLFFSFLKPWSGSGIYWHFAALGCLAAMIALGLFYRIAAALFCVGFTYVFLLEKALYLNHLYLVCLFSFLFVLVPAHNCWSLDNLRCRITRSTVPNWSVLIFRAQVVLVYFYGGIAKINEDWLHGEPQRTWMAAKSNLPWIGQFVQSDWFVGLITYGGIAVDLSLSVLLLWRKTFWIGVGIAVLFHLSNSFLFSIGIFPILMIATIGLFASANWPRTCIAHLKDCYPGLRLFLTRLREHVRRRADHTTADRSRPDIAVLALLHVYILLQLIIPLRHWLYPGNVHWTEEGHRFSWHMMLRHKHAEITMLLMEPRRGRPIKIDLEKFLTPRQRRKMPSRPDMIQQFAYYIADRYQAEHGTRPAVHAIVMASLNSRPMQHLIDPDVDLAAQPVNLRHKQWIVPLAAAALTRPQPNAGFEEILSD
jgi:vitamin K-dependent gamma-carboxylase